MSNLNLRNPNGYDGQPGTQYKQGIVRFATDAEAELGTASNVAITPAQLQLAGAADFASPPVLGFGSTTPRPVHATSLTSTGATTIGSGAAAATAIGNTTGTLGFYGSIGTTRGTQAALTNSVAVGGTTGTIANYTDLTVYANDAATIRNDIYQLSLALTNVIAVLRGYGLLA